MGVCITRKVCTPRFKRLCRLTNMASVYNTFKSFKRATASVYNGALLHLNCKKHYYMKEMLYEVRCLKSNEEMILALAGQF